MAIKKINSKKKFCLLFILLICFVAVMTFVSCNKKNEEIISTIENQNRTIFKFSDSAKSMSVGDNATLVIVTDDIDGIENVIYESTDSEIVSVEKIDNNAYLTANRVGSAKIIASIGELVAECNINVTVGEFVPVINFDFKEKDLYKISLNDTFNIKPYVSFNGKKFYDVDVQYQVENTSICSITEDGLIYALQKGETVISAEYSWRGIEIINSYKEFKILVVDNVEVIINNGEIGKVLNLSTVAEHGGNTYTNSVELVPEIYINGIKSECAIEVIDDNNIISFDNLTNNIIAQSSGQAQIKISCVENEEINTTIEVNVEKPITEYSEKIKFSSYFGTLPVETIFGKPDTIVEAYQGDRLLSIEDNKIIDVNLSNKNGISEEQITIFNDKVGYVVHLEAYYARITNADEFVEFFKNKLPDSFVVNGVVTEQYKYGGYVVLDNDIDLSGLKIATSKQIESKLFYMENCVFEGTFDGKGHIISNLTYDASSRYGLFGDFGSATIKNVAFTDVVFANAPYQSVLGRKVYAKSNVIFDNLYISIKNAGGPKATYSGALLVGNIFAGLQISNVIVSYPEVTDIVAPSGVLFGFASYDYPTSISNLYVISKTKYLSLSSTLSNPANTAIWLACDDGDQFSDIGTNPISAVNVALRRRIFNGVDPRTLTAAGVGNGILDKIVRYDDFYQFSLAENDYSSFNSEYWEIVENIPVFKGVGDWREEINKNVKLYADNVATDILTLQVGESLDAVMLSLKYGEIVLDATFRSDSDCIQIQNNQIKALSFSSDPIIIESEYVFCNKTFIKEWLVNTVEEYEIYPEVIMYSAMDKELPLNEIFGEEVELTSLICDGVELLQNGEITGLDNSTKSAIRKELFAYGSNGKTYKIVVDIYTKVIKTANDLKVFEVIEANEIHDGCYILGNNIEYDGSVVISHSQSNGGFAGVFDGNGHYISCNVSSYGVFCLLYEGAVIKNVAFKDMVSTAQYNASILGFQAKGTEKNSVKIQDVYISVKSVYASDFNRFGTILGQGTNQSIMQLKNVVIELEFEGTLPTNGCGALYYTDLGRNGQYQANNIYQNVFIVTKNEMPLVYNPNYTVYAENEQDKVVKQNDCFFYGVYRYNSQQELKNNITEEQLTLFSTEIWDISSNMPSFKF